MPTPIETIPGNNRVTVPSHLLTPGGVDHYVLRVVGDSMIEESICDGDYVVVLRRNTTASGEMAIVIVDDSASIRRVHYEGNIICLRPANPCLQAIRLPASKVRIQGIVVGLMRKY